MKKNRKSIVFMGMKHSGKSSLGRMFAEKRGLPFFDLDDLLEQAAEDDEGVLPPNTKRSCREIYRFSPELFKEFECRGAEKAAAMMETKTIVLALGGGTIENTRAVELLKKHGRLIFLNETPDLLFSRIIRGGVPSFLNSGDPKISFMELCRRRIPEYEKQADLIIDLEGASLIVALEMVEKKL